MILSKGITYFYNMHSGKQRKIEDILLSAQMSDNDKVSICRELLQESAHSKNGVWKSFTPEDLSKQKKNQSLSDFIPSELPRFDTLFGGFRRGEMVIVAARPGMGKTAFLNRLALRHSLSRKVLYLQFEQSGIPFYDSLIREAGVEDDDVETLLSAEEAERRLWSRNLKIVGAGSSDFYGLTDFLEQEMSDFPADILILDNLQYLYLQLSNHSRDRELSKILCQLHTFTVKHNCVFLISSHLSRGTEYSYNKIPGMSHLRESGSIEMFADKIIFLYRPSYYKINMDEDGNDLTHLMELILAKNRSGSTGDIRYSCSFSPFRLSLFPEAREQFELPPSPERNRETVKDNPF